MDPNINSPYSRNYNNPGYPNPQQPSQYQPQPPFQNYPNQNYPNANYPNQNYPYNQNNYQPNYYAPNPNMNYPIHSNIPGEMEYRERPFVLSAITKKILMCIAFSSFAVFFIVFFITMSKH